MATINSKTAQVKGLRLTSRAKSRSARAAAVAASTMEQSAASAPASADPMAMMSNQLTGKKNTVPASAAPEAKKTRGRPAAPKLDLSTVKVAELPEDVMQIPCGLKPGAACFVANQRLATDASRLTNDGSFSEAVLALVKLEPRQKALLEYASALHQAGLIKHSIETHLPVAELKAMCFTLGRILFQRGYKAAGGEITESNNVSAATPAEFVSSLATVAFDSVKKKASVKKPSKVAPKETVGSDLGLSGDF